MRKLHSLISLLLVLLMLAPCALADAPLLQAASDWNLADTPLSVTLSISLQAHAPFDETRTAMLDRVLAPLSLNLYAADSESGVSVLMRSLIHISQPTRPPRITGGGGGSRKRR